MRLGHGLLSTDDGLTVNVTSSATGDFLYSRVVCGEAAVGSIAESSTNPTKILTWENDHGAFTSSGHYAASDGSGTESFIWTWTTMSGRRRRWPSQSLVLPLISPTKETHDSIRCEQGKVGAINHFTLRPFDHLRYSLRQAGPVDSKGADILNHL